MPECACACDIDDFPKVYSEKIIRARKSYKCCECKGEISPGEQYQRAQGLWDGGWNTYRTCKPCVGIRKDVCGNGVAFGELRDVVWECLGFDYTGKVPDDEDEDEEEEDDVW